MERLFNVMYYFIFSFDYNAHLLFNRINPFVLIHKNPIIKKFDQKNGVNNFEKEVNKAFKDPNNGLSSLRSWGIIHLIVFLFCFALTNIFTFFHPILLNFYYFSSFMGISLIINYLLIFRNKKYLVYFKEFKRWPKNKKMKIGWWCFIIIVGVFFFFIGSFHFSSFK